MRPQPRAFRDPITWREKYIRRYVRKQFRRHELQMDAGWRARISG